MLDVLKPRNYIIDLESGLNGEDILCMFLTWKLKKVTPFGPLAKLEQGKCYTPLLLQITYSQTLVCVTCQAQANMPLQTQMKSIYRLHI